VEPHPRSEMKFRVAGSSRRSLLLNLDCIHMTRIFQLLLLLCVPCTLAENWPQFRGAQGQGLSSERGLPVRWTPTSGIRWKTPLPGPGHSSPIVWGNRVFLTAFSPPAAGSPRSRLLVICVEKKSGNILWERDVATEEFEKVHPANSPASPTPVTDGKHIYVYFGSRGLFCFDFAGRKVWEHLFGPYRNEEGTGSSPLLWGNLLIQKSDTDEEDFLLAVDKRSGKIVWKTSRGGMFRSSSTPIVWRAESKDELVVCGSRQVKGYDPQNGAELWVLEGLTQWVSPSPVTAHGLLYAVSNGPGGNVTLAIRPGGRGNIAATHVVWKYEKFAPYISSPIVVGGYLFAVRDGGVMGCINAKTGALAWQQRLPARGNYFASPVSADGKIYTLSEEGDVSVVAAKPEFEVLASNSIGERCMASPAISEGLIFIRSDNQLYCIEGF
jgi:outer membrane protein assembly factor BamB